MHGHMSPDPRFLIQAELESQLFLEKNVRERLLLEDDQSLFRALLGDPILRPILELSENGTTSLEGALSLKALGFLNESWIQIDDGALRGQKIQIVSLDPKSRTCLERWKHRLENRPKSYMDPLQLFTKCVRSYLACDKGSGIVMTNKVAEVALELFDEKLLGRAALLEYDLFQFDLDPHKETVSESDWMDREKYWSRNSTFIRSGAKIIDLWEAW